MYERLLAVEKPEGDRWNLALDLLREGTSIVFRNLVLEPRDDELRVSVISRYEKPTEAGARAEIDAARQTVEALLAGSPALADLVAGRSFAFELVNDYGMGAVTLCVADAAGNLHWS